MNIFKSSNVALTSSLALVLALVASPATSLAQATHRATAATTTGGSNNTGGVGRQGNGQPLRVRVMHDGKPFVGAHIAVSVSDGSVVLRGITRANGVFVTNSLDQGIYTVTATTAHDTASGPVTLVQSTDPAVVDLTLAPKP